MYQQPTNLTQSEQLRAFLVPLLASYQEKHKQELFALLKKELANFRKTTAEHTDRVRSDLAFSQGIPEKSNIHVGSAVPDRAIGDNREIYFQTNTAGDAILRMYQKSDNGQWLDLGAFESVGIEGPAGPEGPQGPAGTDGADGTGGAGGNTRHIETNFAHADWSNTLTVTSDTITVSNDYVSGLVRVEVEGATVYDVTQATATTLTTTRDFSGRNVMVIYESTS